MNVDHPAKAFGRIDRPVCVLAGEKDELFFAERIVRYAMLPEAEIRRQSVGVIIPGATHLSVLLSADETIGRFILNRIPGRTMPS
jgi:hypothetical protein